jgi:hypothetical protein
LSTWKEKTLPTVIEEEIKKRFPAETEEQKKLRKLEQELNEEKRARLRESLKNKAISFLTTNKMPVELSDFLLGENEDITETNLRKISELWAREIQKAVEEKFKQNGRTPHTGVKSPADIDTLIAKAESEKNFKEAIRLKNEKLRLLMNK